MADTVRAVRAGAEKEQTASDVAELGAGRSGGVTWGDLLRALVDDKVVLVAVCFIILVIGSATFAGFVSPHDPYAQSIRTRMKPPGTPAVQEGAPPYLLGTDQLGRDVLARLLPRLLLLGGLLGRLCLLRRDRAGERRDDFQRLIGCALTRFPGAADRAPERFMGGLARIEDAVAQRLRHQDASRRLAADGGGGKCALYIGRERPLCRMRALDRLFHVRAEQLVEPFGREGRHLARALRTELAAERSCNIDIGERGTADIA